MRSHRGRFPTLLVKRVLPNPHLLPEPSPDLFSLHASQEVLDGIDFFSGHAVACIVLAAEQRLCLSAGVRPHSIRRFLLDAAVDVDVEDTVGLRRDPFKRRKGGGDNERIQPVRET